MRDEDGACPCLEKGAGESEEGFAAKLAGPAATCVAGRQDHEVGIKFQTGDLACFQQTIFMARRRCACV